MSYMSYMLAVRLEPDLERKLAAVAKQQGRTKSAVIREAIRRYLDAKGLAEEARRQSLVVQNDAGERERPRLRRARS